MKIGPCSSIASTGYSQYDAVYVERNRYFVLLLVCLLLIALMMVTFICLMPLKVKEPYVISLSNPHHIPTLLAKADFTQLSKDKSLTRYFVEKYINARFEYSWGFRYQNANVVRALSAEKPYKAYVRWIKPTNAQSPIKQLGKQGTTIVHIKHCSFPYPNLAEVQFVTESKSNAKGKAAKQHWLATLRFAYQNNAINLRDRVKVNPVGFLVTDFKVDQEVSS